LAAPQSKNAGGFQPMGGGHSHGTHAHTHDAH